MIPAPPTVLRAAAAGSAVMIYFETPSPFCLYRLYRETKDGKSVMLGEFSGGEGSVAYTDGGLDAGTYTYYVIPVHPQL